MKRKFLCGFALGATLVSALFAETVSGAKAKKREIRLNRSSITVKNGDSAQLKLLNTETKKLRSVKWSSGNRFTVSVNQNGKVTGRRLGITTVTVKVGKKKFRCKVKVCSDLEEDAEKVSYANDVFTEAVCGQVKQVEYSGMTVKDPKAVRAIFHMFSALRLTEVPHSSEYDSLIGGLYAEFTLRDGKRLSAHFKGNRFFAGGKGYEYRFHDRDVLDGELDRFGEKLIRLVKRNQDFGKW